MLDDDDAAAIAAQQRKPKVVIRRIQLPVEVEKEVYFLLKSEKKKKRYGGCSMYVRVSVRLWGRRKDFNVSYKEKIFCIYIKSIVFYTGET